MRCVIWDNLFIPSLSVRQELRVSYLAAGRQLTSDEIEGKPASAAPPKATIPLPNIASSSSLFSSTPRAAVTGGGAFSYSPSFKF